MDSCSLCSGSVGWLLEAVVLMEDLVPYRGTSQPLHYRVGSDHMRTTGTTKGLVLLRESRLWLQAESHKAGGLVLGSCRQQPSSTTQGDHVVASPGSGVSPILRELSGNDNISSRPSQCVAHSVVPRKCFTCE